MVVCMRIKTKVRVSIKPFFILSLWLLTASNILNTTEYRADLEYVLIPLAVCTAFAIFTKKRLWDISYLYILLMMFFAVVSTVVSPVNFLKPGHLKFYVFVVTYILISSVILDGKDIKKVLMFYKLFSLAVSLWIIVTYAMGTGVNLQYRAALVWEGVEKDQNYVGAFLVPGMVLFFYSFLYSKGRVLNLLGMLIVFVAVYLTGSRAALITCVFCIPLAMLFAGKNISRTRRVIYIIVLAAVAAAVYTMLSSTDLFERMTDVEGYSDNIRLTIWAYAMQGFYEHPILGDGLYAGSYYSQLHTRWVTHNSFIDILVGQGLVGTILFVLIFGKMIIVKQKKNRLFIVVLMVSFFLPYFFLNGYETLSFWLPMILCKFISDYCQNNDFVLLFQKK